MRQDVIIGGAHHFSGLRLGLISALVGVVGAELLAAEHGLGQTLAYLQSTFSMDGVLALLALIGLTITTYEPYRAGPTGLAIAPGRRS